MLLGVQISRRRDYPPSILVGVNVPAIINPIKAALHFHFLRVLHPLITGLPLHIFTNRMLISAIVKGVATQEAFVGWRGGILQRSTQRLRFFMDFERFLLVMQMLPKLFLMLSFRALV